MTVLLSFIRGFYHVLNKQNHLVGLAMALLSIAFDVAIKRTSEASGRYFAAFILPVHRELSVHIRIYDRL